MDLSRIKYLRGEMEAMRLSWHEVYEIESAFREIDPATLPEPAENAGWSDMLDELEVRAEMAAPPAFTREDWRVIEVALIHYAVTDDERATLSKATAMHDAAVQADRDAIDAELEA